MIKDIFWIWLVGAILYLLYQLFWQDESDLSADEQTPIGLMPVIAFFWFIAAPVQFYTAYQLKKQREKEEG
jgi:hypothetical protein